MYRAGRLGAVAGVESAWMATAKRGTVIIGRVFAVLAHKTFGDLINRVGDLLFTDYDFLWHNFPLWCRRGLFLDGRAGGDNRGKKPL